MLLCVCFSRPFKDSKLKKSAHLNFILLLLVFPSSFGLSIPSCLITVVFSHPPRAFPPNPLFLFSIQQPLVEICNCFFFQLPLETALHPFLFHLSRIPLSLSLFHILSSIVPCFPSLPLSPAAGEIILWVGSPTPGGFNPAVGIVNFDNLVMEVGMKALAYANKHKTHYPVKRKQSEREGGKVSFRTHH